MLTAGVNAAKLLKYTYFRLMHLNERSVRYTLHLFRDICGDRDMFRGIKIEKSDGIRHARVNFILTYYGYDTTVAF